MSEREWRPTEAELEQALRDLGAQVRYPSLAPVDVAVRRSLQARPAGGPTPRPLGWQVRSLWRRLIRVALALVLLTGAVLAIWPDARAAIATWFNLPGVVFLRRPAPPVRPPAVVGAPLGLGQRLVLPALGAPDEVYLEALAHGTQVALVYRPRPGLPPVAGTRVGLLLTETRGAFDHNPAYFKGLEPGTRVESVEVRGVPAYWLTGKPHLFWYSDVTGALATERIRLAGNTLLWARAGLIFRLESALSREAALQIAASLR